MNLPLNTQRQRDAFIAQNWMTMSDNAMGDVWRCSPQAIASARLKLGIVRRVIGVAKDTAKNGTPANPIPWGLPRGMSAGETAWVDEGRNPNPEARLLWIHNQDRPART